MGIAQLDLANGTRFQVQMKDRLTVFHLHLESHAVRKIRLRYTQSELHLSVYHMSQNVTFYFILAVHAVLKFSIDRCSLRYAAVLRTTAGEGRSKGAFGHADYCNFVNFYF